MYDLAESSKQWTAESGRYWFDVRTFWQYLIGIGGFAARKWTRDHRPIVSRMSEYYARWAARHLPDDRSALLFLLWLEGPAAAPIRASAAVWIRDAAQEADDYWWKEDGLQDAMAAFTDACWREQRGELADRPDADFAFKQIVRMLADRQHPLAMDLQDRIASGI